MQDEYRITVTNQFSRCPPVRVKLADTLERRVALRARGFIYAGELGHHGLDTADSTAMHLVALVGDDIVAAVRLVGPTPLPLEVTRFFPNLGANQKILQVGGFWIHSAFRRVTSWNIRVPIALHRETIRIARRLNVHGIYLRTHVPNVKPFYQAAGFQPVSQLDFHHPQWGHVYSMYLTVETTK